MIINHRVGNQKENKYDITYRQDIPLEQLPKE